MKRNFRKYLIGFFGLCLVLLFLGVWIYFSLNQKNDLKVFFFDVGQGDASLIRTSDGKNILIDGGPDEKILSSLSEVLPWWDRSIDLIILTHPHDDHIVGLVAVLKKYRVKQVLQTGVKYSTPTNSAWSQDLVKKNIKTSIVEHPQEINLGPDCSLKILYPLQSFSGIEIKNLNNSSIVSRLDCEGEEVLFMGDAEKEVEAELLVAYSDLKSKIIKTGHHGSETASIEEFLLAVDPEKAIISVGEGNKFGLPDLRILRRLERLGIEIFRTDEDGAIVLEKDTVTKKQ